MSVYGLLTDLFCQGTSLVATTSKIAILACLPQITPFVSPPSSAILQSRRLLTPIVPISTQSEEVSTTFKEYVERTIARMHAPPQEPPIERSRTVMPRIPIQTMSFGTVGGATASPSLETMAISAPAMPQAARIGGLKLEMLEKYTNNCVPAIYG